jgi:hypothetical protein
VLWTTKLELSQPEILCNVKVEFNPSAAAICVFQVYVPWGVPGVTHSRNASISASVCAAFTQFAAPRHRSNAYIDLRYAIMEKIRVPFFSVRLRRHESHGGGTAAGVG